MKSIRITAELIQEAEGGFTVYCPELDIYTQGESEQECLDNLREAAELHLEELGTGGVSQVIRREIEVSTSDYDKEKLEERLAKLAGGVAKVNVGAATESEMKEKKARVEDALHATRAAVEEGILPGGGVALLRATSQLKPSGLSHDEEVGFNIVVRACRAPLTWR